MVVENIITNLRLCDGFMKETRLTEAFGILLLPHEVSPQRRLLVKKGNDIGYETVKKLLLIALVERCEKVSSLID